LALANKSLSICKKPGERRAKLRKVIHKPGGVSSESRHKPQMDSIN